MIESSTRGQRRRTERKRNKAKNPPKYPVGTVLIRELTAKEDFITKQGEIIKKGRKYFQSYAEMKRG